MQSYIWSEITDTPTRNYRPWTSGQLRKCFTRRWPSRSPDQFLSSRNYRILRDVSTCPASWLLGNLLTIAGNPWAKWRLSFLSLDHLLNMPSDSLMILLRLPWDGHIGIFGLQLASAINTGFP